MDLKYCTRAILSLGLYIFYPISQDHFFDFKEIFQKILSLCMAYIQERLLIKSGLWWRAYGRYYWQWGGGFFTKFATLAHGATRHDALDAAAQSEHGFEVSS